MGMCGLGSSFDKLSALVIIVPPPPQLNTKICDPRSRLCLAGRVLEAIVSALELILRIIGNHAIGLSNVT